MSSPSLVWRRRCRCTSQFWRTRIFGGAGFRPPSSPSASSRATEGGFYGSPQPADPLRRPRRLLLGRVRVRALFVHLLYPQLLQENVERRDQGDREQDTGEPEERAHDQEREDDDRRVQRDRPAHHHRLDNVPLDELHCIVREDYPQDCYGILGQGQEDRRDHGDERPDERYKGQKPAQDSQQEREGYTDYEQGYGEEHADDHHVRELPQEPPLDALVHLSENLSDSFPP